VPIVSCEVQPLFAEPYFRANIASAIGPDEIAFVQQLKMIDNIENSISESMQIFEEPELKRIKDAVQDVLDFYAREVMGLSQQWLYVTQSWCLTNRSNVGMHGHSHSNSLISGSLYYCPLPDPPANMVFTRHVSYNQIELPPDRARRNIYNTPIATVTPAQNDMILFSSRLTHMVETNQTNQTRHAIAFNTFVRGKFGGRTTELNLK
jgi:uncharacterized protein (TIGR02466 family)